MLKSPRATVTKRIESIDMVRGLVMVIMALDHVRDFFHISAGVDDPMNLATTTPALFFTRWITHFCAPVFIFLSGTSIYLQSLRKTRQELSTFLLKRGLWLIIVEVTLVTFAWTFNPFYNSIALQVIWTIGISMLLMGLLLRIGANFNTFLALGFLIVVGHNLLDIPEAAPGFESNFWWDLLHRGSFAAYAFAPDHVAVLIYPFPAWTGVMMLGYCLGRWFAPDYTAERRRKQLFQTGIAVMLFFIALRATNLYGDPVDWTVQKNGLYTFFSFIDTAKYPPSLLYLCMTLGPALLLLAFIEKRKNQVTDALVVFGRTAFFYYILHLYLIHLLATIRFFAGGHELREGFQSFFLFVIPGEGYELPGVYGVWLLVVAILYPICRSYDRFKTRRREITWLSYL